NKNETPFSRLKTAICLSTAPRVSITNKRGKQIVAARPADFAPNEFPDGRRFRQDDPSIHLRGVRFSPRDVRLIDQQFQFVSYLLRCDFARDFLLQRHCPPEARAFLCRGNLAGHLRGARAFLLRVFENPKPLKTNPFDELEE